MVERVKFKKSLKAGVRFWLQEVIVKIWEVSLSSFAVLVMA